MYWKWDFIVLVLAAMFMFVAAAPLEGNLTGVDIVSTIVGETPAQLSQSSPDTLVTTLNAQRSFSITDYVSKLFGERQKSSDQARRRSHSISRRRHP